MRRLEGEGTHGLDDFNRTCERDEGDLRIFRNRHHSHGRACGGATNDCDYAVIFNETRCESAGLIGVAAIIIQEEAQLLAFYAALGVDFINQHLQRLCFGITQERSRASFGDSRADLDVSKSSSRHADGNDSRERKAFRNAFHV